MQRLYHYTNEDSAAAILEDDDLFVLVGSGNWFGDGYYATPIEPEDDPDFLQHVITQCFAGQRIEPQVAWVLTLREYDFEHRFVPVEEHADHWLIEGSPLHKIYLSELLERVSRWRGGWWETVWENEGL